MLSQALGCFKSVVLALLGPACHAAAEAPPKRSSSPGNTDESWLRGVRRLVDNIEARKHYLR